MSVRSSNRAPVVFFNITSEKGVDLGWVGYCDSIQDAMIPAVMHLGGIDGAESRAKKDPPVVLSLHNGDAFVPYRWIVSMLKDDDYRLAVDAMKMAAERAYKEIRHTPEAQRAKG